MMVLWILRWLIVGTVWTIIKYPMISEEERLRMIEEDGVPRELTRIVNFVATMLNVPIWPIDVMYTVYNIVKYINE